MKRPYKDISGQTFGRLTAIEVIGQYREGKGAYIWLFKCVCGGHTKTRAINVTNGNTQSCGCHNRQSARERLTTHGLRQHPLYSTWAGMRDRCNNPNHSAYPYYGGRGVKVCPAWNDFFQFLIDMRNPPTPYHTLDRIDNDGNYEPANCKWSTKTEQALNRRDNIVQPATLALTFLNDHRSS